MTLFAFGLSHKTAPLLIREKVAFAPDNLTEVLRGLFARAESPEVLILSTCNRSELYFRYCPQQTMSPAELKQAGLTYISDWFCHYHQLDHGQLDPHLYCYTDQAAVQHLLRVASGLDSMVPGEPQILGQVKAAYAEARDAGTLATRLSRLFQYAFSVAKQVRTQTRIGANPVSIAYAAVHLSKQIFAQLSQVSVLLIGAGETVELVARHLCEKGVSKITVANRTLANASRLAKLISGRSITLADIPEKLHEADIIISSTGSQLPILGTGVVQRALKIRKHRPMFIVDLAVPRDVEPEVAQLNDAYLYTIDDLNGIIADNIHARRQEAVQAEQIIDQHAKEFMAWLRSLDSVGTIKEFRLQIEALRTRELARAMQLLDKGEAPQVVLERLSRNLANKFMHQPTLAIKQAGAQGELAILESSRKIFNLKNVPLPSNLIANETVNPK